MLARRLQEELNRPRVVMAQPVREVPFNCGACNTTHTVRNAVPNSRFQCTQCGVLNQIHDSHADRMVVVSEPYPYPLFCTIS